MSAEPELIDWDAPGPYRVAFSTRVGGVSDGPYRSLNLGLATSDEPEHVLENRRRLAAAAQADPDRATMAWQQHGARVERAAPIGMLTAGTPFPRCDGFWSDDPGLPMALVTADCLPVAVCATDGAPALAVLHVGWRGLLAGIVAAGARALGPGAKAGAIGPGIGPCCYEVGEEVAAPFRGAFGADVVAGGRLDLWTAAERALRAAGCASVERTDRCTACAPEQFFSHRRDHGTTGRQGVIGYVVER
jgi:YfiH family protein